MPNPWFRLYSEFEDDPKVQMMPEHMQRRLVMLFCSRCKEERRTDEQMAFKWHVTFQAVTETKRLFVSSGFIDENWNLLNWNKRQFLSDTSTERVRRHRQAKKQVETLHNVSLKQPVTAPDTEAYADTDLNSITPEMVARSVMETCAISGKNLLNVLADVCRARMKAGDVPGDLRDRMSLAWQQYDAQRDAFGVSAEKFFGDGKWNNKASWKKENGNGNGKYETRQQRNERIYAESLARLDQETAEAND